MLAVLALALVDISPLLRSDFMENVAIATTPWLIGEVINKEEKYKSSFIRLMEVISSYFGVGLISFSSGLCFKNSIKKVLREYEYGYVKEGVGAGALAFLAQLKGFSLDQLVEGCEVAVGELESANCSGSIDY